VGPRGVAPLLEALRSPHICGDAWVEFLESYSAVLYQTARACTSDEDAAADCYLHICERLSRNGFRRLLKFKPEGSASFTTWLRVVAQNLCFDWHRSQSGRPRPFRSLQHLSALDLEVYDSRFVHGASRQETLHNLQTRFPGIGMSELSDIEARVQDLLTPRQQWILATRRQPASSHRLAFASDESDPVGTDITDPGPTPETWFADQQIHAHLQKSLATLSTQERLLLQLRFEQELSLNEIARLCGLQDAQRVHRMLTTVVNKLREAMKYSPRKIQAHVRAIE
jgi:RNA polymerase sigma factor (sigma-70 family)